MNKLNVKRMEGYYTHSEAMELCDNNWRIPTIFELIAIAKKHGNKSYLWSSSPFKGFSNLFFSVLHDEANVDYENEAQHVILIEDKGVAFEYGADVCREETNAFESNLKLPAWHPEFEIGEME